MSEHQVESLPGGGSHCPLCGNRFSGEVWGECPGVRQFAWDPWPEGMLTAKQIKQKRLTPGPVRGAIYYPKAADGSGWLWLYREDEATPNPVSEKKRLAVEKGKATKRARRTCQMCGVYQADQMEAAYVLASGFCRCCEIRRWAQELLNQPFVVLDLETTGLDSDADILQIGLVSSSGDVLLDTYIKPVEPIDERRYLNVDDWYDDRGPRMTAFGVNGISNAMVADAPPFLDVYPRLCELLQGQSIVCYNVSFDRRRLKESCERHHLPVIEATWKCAQVAFAQFYGDYSRKYGDYKYKSLSFACAYLGVDMVPTHDGAEDALATLHVVRALASPPKPKETKKPEGPEGEELLCAS